jgi:hypothetical protein
MYIFSTITYIIFSSIIFYIYYLLFIYLLSIYHLFIYLLFIPIFHLFLFISYSSLPNPASSPAGRAPPCGGIARPKGKHSRHKGVLCPPAADSRPESG